VFEEASKLELSQKLLLLDKLDQVGARSGCLDAQWNSA